MSVSPPAVLLIEDDEIDRERIHRYLRERYRVDDANTAHAAYSMLDQVDYSVALLDYRLPDAMGFELLPELRSRNMAIVMLTGEGNEQIAVEAIKEGCHDYLVKSQMSGSDVERAIQTSLRQVQLARELADKQRELQGFVSVAAHDLRTPVYSIIGMADMLCSEFGDELSEDALELTRRISQSAERMEKLISSLLSYAEHGRGERSFGPVNLTNVFSAILFDLREAIQQTQAQISVKPFPLVWGDETALRQLFQNLLSNAIKFCDERSPQVDVTAEEHAGQVLVHVCDNGIGIAPEHLRTIFDPFFRLHGQSRFEGSGIGLATCQRIVDQHGGRITVQSEPGRGTTFSVHLPQRKTETDEKNSQATPLSES